MSEDHGELDPSRKTPTAAGVWGYWQDPEHSDYWPVEKDAGDAVAAAYPGIFDYAANSRSWHRRAVGHAASTLGITQFADIGAGLPLTHHNTHQIAQRHQPAARTLYVDIDPRVVLHQQAVTGTNSGQVACRQADMRDTDTVQTAIEQHFDMNAPIALLFSDCLGHIHDLDEALGAVHRLRAQLRPGGLLMLSHSTFSSDSEYARVRYTARPKETVAQFFDGLELVEPGLVSVQDWHPDGATPKKQDLYHSTVASIALIPAGTERQQA